MRPWNSHIHRRSDDSKLDQRRLSKPAHLSVLPMNAAYFQQLCTASAHPWCDMLGLSPVSHYSAAKALQALKPGRYHGGPRRCLLAFVGLQTHQQRLHLLYPEYASESWKPFPLFHFSQCTCWVTGLRSGRSSPRKTTRLGQRRTGRARMRKSSTFLCAFARLFFPMEGRTAVRQTREAQPSFGYGLSSTLRR